MLDRLRIEFNKLDGDIETAQNEAYKKRSVAEEHLRAYLQKKKEDEEKKRRDDEKMIADDDDLDYVDTLMINEEGDIDDNNNDVDFILNDKLSIDGLVQQVEDYINTKLVICMPNLSEHCFIHYESQQKIDHNSFSFETNQFDNAHYLVGKECAVKISCPLNGTTKEELFSSLVSTLIDSRDNQIKCELVHRQTEDGRRHMFKILFKPERAGIHKLSIKYDGFLIKDCPICLPVYIDSNKSSSILTNGIHNGSEVSSKQTAMGRGRIFKNIRQNEHSVKTSTFNQSYNDSLNDASQFQDASSSSIQSFPPQKRKSPTYPQVDDVEVVSSKLKKVIVNEIHNQTHTYRRPSSSSSNHSENNVHDRLTFSNDNIHSRLTFPSDKHSNINLSGVLDSHLKKYANISALDSIPSIKASFVGKYEAKLNYPIGVCVSTSRNWLLLADTGNNIVKIFNRKNGELLHTILADQNGTQYFKRPSALIISEKDSELFVKDDKEIFAFDLNNFSLKRKFGFQILRKPYGLTFDHEENLVLVDANLRDPRIIKFSKEGKLLSTNNFQPMDQQIASDLSIFPNLKQPPVNFDRTKIRFMCFAHNCLYVSDLGRSIVYKCSLDGQILLAFGFNGHKKGEINEPSGILVDIGGSILVGDSKNDRLQVYDQNGKYKCQIEFNDGRIKRPSDIYVDKEGYLYVTCFLEHCVKRFKFDI